MKGMGIVMKTLNDLIKDIGAEVTYNCDRCKDKYHILVENDEGKKVAKECICMNEGFQSFREMGKEDLEELKERYIPEYYLENNYKKTYTSSKFSFNEMSTYYQKEVRDKMDIIVGQAETGLMPKNHQFLYAPSGFGKRTFLYKLYEMYNFRDMNPSYVYNLTELKEVVERKTKEYRTNYLYAKVILIHLTGYPYSHEIQFLRQLIHTGTQKRKRFIIVSSIPKSKLFSLDESFTEMITTYINRDNSYSKYLLEDIGLDNTYSEEYYENLHKIVKEETFEKVTEESQSNYNGDLLLKGETIADMKIRKAKEFDENERKKEEEKIEKISSLFDDLLDD